MKTVSGKVISSKPISISKAARVLSTFISAETGASQAVSAYLRRASAAFIELTQLHKELKASRSERKGKKRHSLTTNSENPNEAVENSRGSGSVFEGDNTVSGRERSQRGSKGEVLNGNEENESVRKKEKKKQKNVGDSGKFRDNHGEVDVGGSEVCGSMVIEEQKRKKRKITEVEDDSEARRSKKKRRRGEGDG